MDGRDSCMMLGPIECKTYSCIECEKRDDIWCNELNCCLDIWLHPKANCPYLIHVVVDTDCGGDDAVMSLVDENLGGW